ncbi:response regulator [Pseudomonas sp. TE3610]
MIRIGNVTVSLALREIHQGGVPVKVGSRAFDILEVLVAAQGQLVSKDELLARVWPGAVVEENNLQVHISALRKALGEARERIRTVPGRGYRLVLDAEPDAQPPVATGRDSLLIALLQRLGLHDMLDAPGTALPEAPPVPAHGEPIVYVVDDEASVRDALSRLLRSADIAVRTFATADDFLASDFDQRLACLVLDVNLSIGTGFDLQAELRRRASALPIIFMTGYGTIPMSVKAIKAGAQEFLTKPFDENELLDAIDRALAGARQGFAVQAQAREVRGRYQSLTPRERQVLGLLLEGKPNKLVAAALGTREVTAKVHKKHVMAKMRAATLVDLVRLCEQIGVNPVQVDAHAG